MIHQGAANAPHFISGVSVFLAFLDGAGSLLGNCLSELEKIADNDLIGEDIKANFTDGSISVSDPLSSTMPLAQIMQVIQSTRTLCRDNRELETLLGYQCDFADWVSSHEIHVLLGGLRLPSHTSSFLFSVCDMDLESWKDFASDSMLFGAILKAVWLRCIRGTTFCSVDGNAQDDCKALRHEIVLGADPAGRESMDRLENFKNHFVENHYNPVAFLFAHFHASSSHCFLIFTSRRPLVMMSTQNSGRKIMHILCTFSHRLLTTAHWLRKQLLFPPNLLKQPVDRHR
jgi:hypothetical protein